MLEESVEVHVAAFSTAKESLPEGAPEDTLANEFLKAMSILGVPRDNLVIFDYPVRRLSYHRQEVLENVVSLHRELKPDIVLVPSGADVHQDHQVLYAEAVRACKRGTLWGYELPWNHITFAAQAFVHLQSRHLERKWDALQAYQSQMALNRHYFAREFIEGLARVRGSQVGEQFAEAFEVVRTTL